ncbi:hypothetical protein WAK64_13275 [Bacillus spongiae]|uniref:Uncharacterized protein n=1 Tax=Bacillus spongiae TaxID=2683610 RepID=A0ABU8HFN2_9BACI
MGSSLNKDCCLAVALALFGGLLLVPIALAEVTLAALGQIGNFNPTTLGIVFGILTLIVVVIIVVVLLICLVRLCKTLIKLAENQK